MEKLIGKDRHKNEHCIFEKPVKVDEHKCKGHIIHCSNGLYDVWECYTCGGQWKTGCFFGPIKLKGEASGKVTG